MFLLGLIYLVVNRFYPFIFSFNADHEYVTEPGRHIAFVLQIAIYLVTTVSMLHIARKSTGGDKVRYRAFGCTCFVMALFLILQILNFNYPSYAIGLIIRICVVHSFVEAGELKEKEIYDHIATSLAEDYEAIYYINLENGEYLGTVRFLQPAWQNTLPKPTTLYQKYLTAQTKKCTKTSGT